MICLSVWLAGARRLDIITTSPRRSIRNSSKQCAGTEHASVSSQALELKRMIFLRTKRTAARSSTPESTADRIRDLSRMPHVFRDIDS